MKNETKVNKGGLQERREKRQTKGGKEIIGRDKDRRERLKKEWKKERKKDK